MIADPMPTATLVSALLHAAVIPVAVGLLFAGVQWIAGRVRW